MGNVEVAYKTLKTMCDERAWQQQRWESCANGSDLAKLRFSDHRTNECWELLAQTFDRF